MPLTLSLSLQAHAGKSTRASRLSSPCLANQQDALAATAAARAWRTPAMLSDLSEEEIVRKLEQCLSKPASGQMVRDSWRCFTALSLDRRKQLPVALLEQLLDLQLSRTASPSNLRWFQARRGGILAEGRLIYEQGPRVAAVFQARSGRAMQESIELRAVQIVQEWLRRVNRSATITRDAREAALQSIRDVAQACLDSARLACEAGADPEHQRKEEMEAHFERRLAALRVMRELVATEGDLASRIELQHLLDDFHRLLSLLGAQQSRRGTLPPLSEDIAAFGGDLMRSCIFLDDTEAATQVVDRLLRAGIVPPRESMERLLLATPAEDVVQFEQRMRNVAGEPNVPERIRTWALEQLPGAAPALNDMAADKKQRLHSLALRALDQTMLATDQWYRQHGSSSTIAIDTDRSIDGHGDGDGTAAAVDERIKIERANALTASGIYQGLLAGGISPDDTLYAAIASATRLLSHESVAFPLLRTLAVQHASSHRDEQRVHAGRAQKAQVQAPAPRSALAQATPEQLFRLALETADYALAKALYGHLRSRGGFRWQPERDEGAFVRLFKAAAAGRALALDASPASTCGSESGSAARPGIDLARDRQIAKGAAQLYLDWIDDMRSARFGVDDLHQRRSGRAEGVHADTPAAVVDDILHLIPRIADIATFRRMLDTLLSDAGVSLKSSQLTRFFEQLRVQAAHLDMTRRPASARTGRGETRGDTAGARPHPLRSIWKVEYAYGAVTALAKHTAPQMQPAGSHVWTDNPHRLPLAAYNACLRALAEYPLSARVERADIMFRAMVKRGVRPDLASYNHLLRLYSRTPQHAGRAETLFAQLATDADAAHRPDAVTYSHMIRAACRADELNKAVQWLREAGGRALVVRSSAIRRLLGALRDSGRACAAREAYELWADAVRAAGPATQQEWAKEVHAVGRLLEPGLGAETVSQTAAPATQADTAIETISEQALENAQGMQNTEAEALAFSAYDSNETGKTRLPLSTFVSPAFGNGAEDIGNAALSAAPGRTAEEGHAANAAVMADKATGGDDRRSGHDGERTHAKEGHWRGRIVPERQSFLTAFFTSNGDAASPESASARVARCEQGQTASASYAGPEQDDSLQRREVEAVAQQSSPAHHRQLEHRHQHQHQHSQSQPATANSSSAPIPTPTQGPAAPSAFAPFAFPSFSQNFSTSSRTLSPCSVPDIPATAIDVGSSSSGSATQSNSSSSSSSSSHADPAIPPSSLLSALPNVSLSSLPFYLADFTFAQLSGLYQRYQLEMDAIRREEQEQSMLKVQRESVQMQRADADRWRGWKEVGAVPWY